MDNEKEILSALLSDRKYKDLILDCQGIKIGVHRAIVCAQSDFFDAACSNGFKETEERCISLPEDDPESIQRLVNYFYTSNYTVDGDDESVNALLAHVRMFELAVKYAVKKLDVLVMKKFPSVLQSALTKSPTAFTIQAVREIFTKIPEKEGQVIRDALLTTQAGQELADVVSLTPEFRDLCEEYGTIGRAFFLARLQYDSQRLKNQQEQIEALKVSVKESQTLSLTNSVTLDTDGTTVRCEGFGCSGTKFTLKAQVYIGPSNSATFGSRPANSTQSANTAGSSTAATPSTFGLNSNTASSSAFLFGGATSTSTHSTNTSTSGNASGQQAGIASNTTVTSRSATPLFGSASVKTKNIRLNAVCKECGSSFNFLRC